MVGDNTGVEVQKWTADVEDEQPTAYKATVEATFAVHTDMQYGEH